jgi:hypothetical protein
MDKIQNIAALGNLFLGMTDATIKTASLLERTTTRSEIIAFIRVALTCYTKTVTTLEQLIVEDIEGQGEAILSVLSPLRKEVEEARANGSCHDEDEKARFLFLVNELLRNATETLGEDEGRMVREITKIFAEMREREEVLKRMLDTLR